MNIPIATDKTTQLDPLERSRYEFEPLTSHIKLKDNGEPLIHQKDIESLGIACEPFWDIPGDLEGDSYKDYVELHPDFSLSLRQDVVRRIVKAQHDLPKTWRLVLKAGFRPYAVQLTLLQSFIEFVRTQHPSWSEDRVQAYARIYVSDPEIVCPPHITGGAVDVDVRDTLTGAYIDFGCPPNTDSDRAFLHSDQLTSAQYSNRMILLKAMLQAGFAPLANEWWHYQYGETYWAAFYGHKATKYDLIRYNKE